MKKIKLPKSLCFTVMATLCLVVTILFTVVSCEKLPKYDIYENHDISACGVDDPLRNVEWLKNFVDGVEQDAKSGYKRHA